MDQPLSDILRTKLYRPRVTDDFIARPRLTERLARGLDRKLVLVTAPPGYGKTTLAASGLHASPMPVAWLSLDEGDNDLQTFLRYVIVALQTIIADACPETWRLLQSDQKTPVAVFSTTLINEIDALHRPLMLVLDDYHLITAAALHDFVTHLVDHQPPDLHLVLITRDSPPLPLVRWRAKRDLLEIRAADLRFTRDEAAQFLSRVANKPIAPETVDMLEDSTEGWIVGLRLAALTLRRQSDQAKFVQSFQQAGSTDVRDYLLDEVLQRQTPALQDFLIKTALLDRFCAALCAALLAQENSAAGFIAELTRANLFIVPLDDRDKWFRYHHLFGEMLRQRAAQRLSAETIAELHRRASAWFAAQQLLDEALQHAFAAGDDRAAALIVEENFSHYLDRNHQSILAGWLARLPEALIASRPRLLIAQIWIDSFRGAYAGLPDRLQQAEQLLTAESCDLDDEQVRMQRGYIAAQRSQLAFYQGDTVSLLDAATQALADLPADAFYARGAAAMYYSYALRLTDQHEEAERFLWQEIDRHRGPDAPFAAQPLLALCSAYSDAAEIDRLADTAQRLWYTADQCDLPLMRGWALYFIGHAQYARNELSSAGEQFTQAIQLNYVAHRQAIYLSRVGLTLVHHAQQKYAEAAADLEELTRLYPEVASDLASLRAQLAWQQGELEPALRWAAGFSVEMPPDPMGWLPVPLMALVWIYLADGTPARLKIADTVLAALWQQAQLQHNTFQLISITATQAWSLAIQDHVDEALHLLEEAVKLAWPGGHIRLLVDVGSGVRDMLQQLRDRGVTPHYLDRVLAAMPSANPIALPVSPMVASPTVDLTWREMEVLRLLAQHLTNQEIAAQLVVTPVAVKKHLGRIYRKLGVDNRRAALARAADLKLL
jgi:LuxR family transcriptional regulator, maltose regulon positive regulatory protein